MSSNNTRNKATELSIILLSYNTRQVTENCLQSIINSLNEKMKKITEIIVLDNNSTDDSVKMLKKMAGKYSFIKLIENKENLGFSKGNNKAVHEAKGDYILLLNSDTLVIDDAIAKLLDFYKNNENTFQFLGGKLLNIDKTDQPSAGPFYTLPVVFGALFLKGDYWGLTRYSPSNLTRVDWVSGACILTKKDYFQELGGFDENIFMYMEEIDLLYRAKQKGYLTYFYPKAVFIHLGSASSGGKTYPILQVYKGFLYFYNKHYSRFTVRLLRVMLQLKAFVSIVIGKITNNHYLTDTYEQAYKIASMVR